MVGNEADVGDGGGVDGGDAVGEALEWCWLLMFVVMKGGKGSGDDWR